MYTGMALAAVKLGACVLLLYGTLMVQNKSANLQTTLTKLSTQFTEAQTMSVAMVLCGSG